MAKPTNAQLTAKLAEANKELELAKKRIGVFEKTILKSDTAAAKLMERIAELEDEAGDPDQDPFVKACLRPFPEEMKGKLPRGVCGDCRKLKYAACGKDDRKWGKHEWKWCDVCSSMQSTAHIHLDYVGHAHITERLLLIDPDWSLEPMALDANGLPFTYERNGMFVMWCELTIGGKTRKCVGTCKVGQDDVDKELYGDALRNGAMRFGIGVALWAKTDLETVINDQVSSSAGVARGVSQSESADSLRTAAQAAREPETREEPPVDPTEPEDGYMPVSEDQAKALRSIVMETEDEEIRDAIVKAFAAAFKTNAAGVRAEQFEEAQRWLIERLDWEEKKAQVAQERERSREEEPFEPSEAVPAPPDPDPQAAEPEPERAPQPRRSGGRAPAEDESHDESWRNIPRPQGGYTPEEGRGFISEVVMNMDGLIATEAKVQLVRSDWWPIASVSDFDIADAVELIVGFQDRGTP